MLTTMPRDWHTTASAVAGPGCGAGGMTFQHVIGHAHTIGESVGCQCMAPCAATDGECECLRLAKLELGIPADRNITAEYDAQADLPQQRSAFVKLS
jgi:hypothetical protein